MTVTYTTEVTKNEIRITAHLPNGNIKQATLPLLVYNVMTTTDGIVSNSAMQVAIAQAMNWSAPRGRCAKAASLIERFTSGYAAFNGFCALLNSHSEGSKRFFSSNTEFLPTEGKMLTGKNSDPKPAQEQPSRLSRLANDHT